MDWKEVGKKIAKAAPLLGKVVGSFVPGASAVGAGIGLLASAFGVTEEDTPEQVLEKIQADPEWMVKLKEIEARHEVELQQLTIQLEMAYLRDVQSARQADVAKTKATGKRDYAMYALATVITVGFFALTSILMFKALPEGSSQAVFMLFGGVNSAFATVVGYFFGSSKTSAEKTKMLAPGGK